MSPKGRMAHFLFGLLLLLSRVASAEAAVKHFTYEVELELPHPSNHFTQGLTFRLSDGAMIEGTGLRSKSVLAVYSEDENGIPTVPKMKVDIPHSHFGEGIAEYLGKLYQLTWQDGKVHVWDPQTLQHLETRKMLKNLAEGWGVCTAPGHDALIMSDGSAKLFWAVPDATVDGGFLLRKEIIVKDCENMPRSGILGGLNELETVPLRLTHPEEVAALHTSDGAPNVERARQRPVPLGATIFANVYGTTCLAIIDPLTGDVKGYVHLDGIYNFADTSNRVFNGIAYRDSDESLWVTGKNWDKMFKIKLKQLDQPPGEFPRKCITTWAYPRGVTPKEKYPETICPDSKSGRRTTTKKTDL